MTKHFLFAASVLALSATSAMAAGHCAAGKTLTEGKFTIATGNPAYFPWVLDDAPESGKGFEAAVAYAVAAEMGFAKDDVVWVRSSFDEAIQPGAKNFDVNMQQYSITAARDEVVDFSVPYYTAPMAVLLAPGAVDTPADMAALKELQWGAVGTTTAVPVLSDLIAPAKDPLLYALFDLPTALFLSAVMIEGSKVLGQFDTANKENPDQFGMLMEEGNPLKTCVDEAIEALEDNGGLAAIEAEWLQDTTGVPVLK